MLAPAIGNRFLDTEGGFYVRCEVAYIDKDGFIYFADLDFPEAECNPCSLDDFAEALALGHLKPIPATTDTLT